jgi:hypothetical protein
VRGLQSYIIKESREGQERKYTRRCTCRHAEEFGAYWKKPFRELV